MPWVISEKSICSPICVFFFFFFLFFFFVYFTCNLDENFLSAHIDQGVHISFFICALKSTYSDCQNVQGILTTSSTSLGYQKLASFDIPTRGSVYQYHHYQCINPVIQYRIFYMQNEVTINPLYNDTRYNDKIR